MSKWLSDRKGEDSNVLPKNTLHIGGLPRTNAPKGQLSTEYIPHSRSPNYLSIKHNANVERGIAPWEQDEFNKLWKRKLTNKQPQSQPRIPPNAQKVLNNKKNFALRDVTNSVQKELQLMVVDGSTLYYYNGHIWANLDVNKLAILLQRTFKGDELITSFGEKEYRDIHRRLFKIPEIQKKSQEIFEIKKRNEVMMQCRDGVFFPLRMVRGESKPEYYNFAYFDINVGEIFGKRQLTILTSIVIACPMVTKISKRDYAKPSGG